MTVLGVTTLLNVTDFLPTAPWITATYSLLFSAVNSKNQKCLNEMRCPCFLSPRVVTSRVFDRLVFIFTVRVKNLQQLFLSRSFWISVVDWLHLQATIEALNYMLTKSPPASGAVG